MEHDQDKAYINKAVKRYERRYRMAAIYGVLGIISSILTYIGYIEITDSSSRLMELFGSHPKEGAVVTEGTINLIKSGYEASYAMGSRAGVTLSFLSAACGIMIGKSIYFLIGAREERAITKLYRKSEI